MHWSVWACWKVNGRLISGAGQWTPGLELLFWQLWWSASTVSICPCEEPQRADSARPNWASAKLLVSEPKGETNRRHFPPPRSKTPAPVLAPPGSVLLCSSSVSSCSPKRGYGFSPAQVPLSGCAGVPDHLTGAHHALLPHPAGRGPAVPGLVSGGGGRGHEDPHLRPAGIQGAQWVRVNSSRYRHRSCHVW